jgi:glycosidase
VRVLVRFSKLPNARQHGARSYFHVRKAARQELRLEDALFSIRGDVVLADVQAAHRLADTLNAKRTAARKDQLQASQLHAMGLIHEVFHAILARYRATVGGDPFGALVRRLKEAHGDDLGRTLRVFLTAFPPEPVFHGDVTVDGWLEGSTGGIANEEWAIEELLLAWLGNENPAYAPIADLVTDEELRRTTPYLSVLTSMRRALDDQPRFGPDQQNLVDMLLAPIRHAPGSILGQLEFMRVKWGLDVALLQRLLLAGDLVKEEGKWFLRHEQGGDGKGDGGDAAALASPDYFKGELFEHEPERFSPDLEWMPRVVMLAKSTFVWLDQLSRHYRRGIRTLDAIPDEELDRLASRGFTGLWLIGIWERSRASVQIKQRMGNSEAVASAYSLHDYEIAPELGGWGAYASLRDRAWRRGVRLASDMVPNHMGIDSRWVVQHPDWFVQSREPPFPSYRFDGPDLGNDDRVGIFIEDGYWSKSDAAVVFKRVDKATGDTRFVYHGNDGTSMPWNDTAQLDYTKAEVREAVIQTILHVARLFPIIRFDAAMTLAKRHYQRLWFPLPGTGGDIPSRAQHAMTKEAFDDVFPVEFWREVVDRVAREVPDTLLLAEAFWMMEGYFVRTLGMHRVYNSAFMHMFKKEDNAGYRASVKNVLAFNPGILKRYVNFMNNPDEDTAIAQFGRDDKYFGVCTVMCTMPGLPMFGHGQVEGYAEKYGMEYKRAYWDETPDPHLEERHAREIFPIMKRRALFADVEAFTFYDVVTDDGHLDEDVFAYSNRRGGERALVVFHNRFKEARGWIRDSVGFLDDSGSLRHRTLGEGLAIDPRDGAFTVFRDHVSGLEHLVESRELCARGLFVALGAFKYHVFWEFREVVDGPDRPYRALADRLAGRGTPSVDEALVDIVHAPVHDALREALRLRAAEASEPSEPSEPADASQPGAAQGGAVPSWRAAFDAIEVLEDATGSEDPIAAFRLDRVLGDDAALVRVLLRARPHGGLRGVAALLNDDAARGYLGVHEHGGVEWLRKEAWDELVLALGALAGAPAADVAKLTAAAEAAGYDVARLRRALA